MSKSTFNAFPREMRNNPKSQKIVDLEAFVSQIYSTQKYFGKDVQIADYLRYCEREGIPIIKTVREIMDDLDEACELHIGGIAPVYDSDRSMDFYHVPERETSGQPPFQKGKNRHNMFGIKAIRARYQADIPLGARAFP